MSLAGLTALVLGLGACSADYATDSKAQYVLLMTGINDGVPLQSDVRLGGTTICPDYAELRVENHSKNPNVTNTGFRGDMVIERYEVRYLRSDGRGTEGVDVPYSITGSLAREVIAEEATTLNIEVVRRQAKVEPPLASLVGAGGPLIVTMFAEITLHARMTTGQATNTATARLQIDFADFADSGTTCEAP
jgi:hypothetical protein